MKIALYLCCGFNLLGGFGWAQEEIDPFAPQGPAAKPVVPHRGVVALPGSIKYEQLEKNRHQYSIGGMDPRDVNDNTIQFCAGLLEHVLPEGVEVEAEIKGDTLVIRVSQPIANDTLAFVVDGIANAGVGIHFWDELVARDLKRSIQFDPEMYEIVEHRGDFPPGLAWVPFYGEMRFHFVTSVGTGILLMGPTTSQCMCHSKCAIRVLDDHGDLLWIAPELALGSLNLAMGDTDNDQKHELYFQAEDHGEKTKGYVLRPKTKQDDR